MISYEQFLEAFQLIASKRFPKKDASTSFDSLLAVVKSSGAVPKLSEGVTKASNDAVVGRMTDTSSYTGSHKERFDQVYCAYSYFDALERQRKRKRR